jgi:lipopolysaccharide export LptBFGC system permease protein LptF
VNREPNYAPWGTPGRMRAMAVVGILASVVLLVIGIGFLVNGNKGGWTPVILAVVLMAFWLVMLPALRRRNKV